jgi:hypothetical protein
MPAAHPLSIKSDSMYDSSQSKYIFQKFVIAKGANFKDTLQINIMTSKDLVFTKTLTFTEGYNAKIPLKINYAILFKDVPFASNVNAIITKIVSNTENAFSIQ